MVESWKPEFITTVGDNNYPTGQAATIDRNIGQFFHAAFSATTTAARYGRNDESVLPDHRQPRLGYPEGLRPTSTISSCRGTSATTSSRGVRCSSSCWILICASRMGATATSIQGRWLERKLAKSKAPWKLVFATMHLTHRGGSRISSTCAMPFKAWGADAVLSGYYHVYERLSVEGLPRTSSTEWAARSFLVSVKRMRTAGSDTTPRMARCWSMPWRRGLRSASSIGTGGLSTSMLWRRMQQGLVGAVTWGEPARGGGRTAVSTRVRPQLVSWISTRDLQIMTRSTQGVLL